MAGSAGRLCRRHVGRVRLPMPATNRARLCISSMRLKSLRPPDDRLDLGVLARAAAALSILELFCARAQVFDEGRRICDFESSVQSALHTTEAKLAELTAEARDREAQPATLLSARLRPGLNLTTRSQVLRLHRHGETAENIARVLEVARQKIDLLLKVHGIVMKGI